MKPTRILIAFALTASACAAALAQSSADHSAHHAPAASTAAPATDGEVRKVDKEQGKLTLKHGRIENLDMPAMTMVFKVEDPAMLDKVKTGDKVKFGAENVNGALVITSIELVK